MLVCAYPAADVMLRYVMCGPALSPARFGMCEQSWGELARPLLHVCWENLEIKGVSRGLEIWVGAC